jgi:protein SCO1/2
MPAVTPSLGFPVVALCFLLNPGVVLAHDSHASHASVAYSRSVQSVTIPALPLVDATGRSVNLTQLLETDKPVLINFIFTSCSAVCPVMAATFSQVQERLGEKRERVRMLSVSIDPEHDTPARLSEYAQRFRARADWHFLTGNQDAIRRVQQAFDVFRGNKSNHLPLTLLRTGPGTSWVRVEGLASPDQLLRELKAQGGV